METEVREPVQLTSALGRRAIETLDGLIAPGGSCAVIDAPLHANVGDSAIWLGQRAYLRRRGVRVAYSADLGSYDPARLAARLPEGVILLTGGGNLGDLWPASQHLRERVVADFPDRSIIQLPQSINFRDPAALARCRAAFDAHPRLTLLVRDRAALALAREQFHAPSHLCPDLAVLLDGSLPATGAPDQEVLWLGRRDHESGQQISGIDWTALEDADPTWSRAYEAVRSGPSTVEVHDAMARLQVERGCRLLASGRVVVTDRLHGHLLSLLLGIPHVVLPDRFGKVRGFWDEWTNGWPHARWAGSVREVSGLVRELTSVLRQKFVR